MFKANLWLSFCASWIGYACTYLLRKPIGVMKSEYGAAMNLKNVQLGGLDLALLLPYSFVQMFFGWVGDRLGPRHTLSLALLGAGLSTIGFAFVNGSYLVFIVMLLFSGAFQSFCWPACNTGIALWKNSNEVEQRQRLLGYFGTSPFAGGIIGTLFAAFLQCHFGWQHILLWPSIIIIVWSGFVFVFFRTPDSESREIRKDPGIPAWRVAGAIPSALAVACLKVVRYGLYFWLPIQLEQRLAYSPKQAANYSALFDVGAAVGCLFSGHILSSLFQSNALIGSAVQVALSAIALGLFIISTNCKSTLFVCICIALIGALNGAPDVILCGSVPAELVQLSYRTRQDEEKPVRLPISAMIGFINGLGSLGGVIEGPLIGVIADHTGWNGVSVTMIAFSLAGSAFCLIAHNSSRPKDASINNIPVTCP